MLIKFAIHSRIELASKTIDESEHFDLNQISRKLFTSYLSLR
jgi:hypothetical protein